MIVYVVLISMVILAAAYVFYGRLLTKVFQPDDSRVTPAVEINDGADFVPAPASMLLGQHFSAIAAAGPIVGPIMAGLWFGWVPALLWVIIGSIFIGGIHDYASLFASIRHRACSIGEIVRSYMSPASRRLFLIFVWIALVYVIIAFTDVTVQTFKTVSANEAHGPGVAVSSAVYLAMGVALGFVLRYLKPPLWLATLVCLPVLAGTIWFGTRLPEPLQAFLVGVPTQAWIVVLIVYCAVASLVPVWVLLQPRGYLGGWFLYLTLAAGLFGALFGGFSVQYPAFNLEGFRGLDNGRMVFPLLFITVACGACSGFHGVVSSGTTSKQLCRESDAKVVGYGAMILEAMVAVLALATVMMIAKGDPLLKTDPNYVYAHGLATYMAKAGISFQLALAFGLLAFSTFVYDTLDVCTRLARYILQELLGWKSRGSAVLATLITLAVPLLFLLNAGEKAYLKAWPIFGTSNQLLASLTLLAIGVWMRKTGRQAAYALLPMAFMMVMTVWSLVLQVQPMWRAAAAGTMGAMKVDEQISGGCGGVLLILTVWLLVEAFRSLRVPHEPVIAPSLDADEGVSS